MKNRSIYLGIISAITIVAIIIGIVIHIGIPFSTFTKNIFNKKISLSGKSMGEVKTVDENVDAFSSIDMDMEIGNVVIKVGDAYNISFTGNEKLIPEISVDDDTIVIKQKTKHLESFGNNKSDLEITVPSNTTLDKIDADLALGNFEINNITAEKFDVDAALGDVKLMDCSFEECDIDESLGNVRVDTPIALDSIKMDLDVSLGNIEINGQNQKTTYKTDGGSVKLDIDNSMGNIEVNAGK